MSFEIERQLPSALGLALTAQILPPGESLPSKATIEARLRDFFSNIHERDTEAINVLRAFVKSNEHWDVYTEGGEAFIDTGYLTHEASGVHLAMTCKRGSELAQDTSLSPDIITDIIRAEATAFQVTMLDEEVLNYSRSIMAPGQSLLSLLRGDFAQDPTIMHHYETGDQFRHQRDDRYNAYFMQGKLQVYNVSLEPPEHDPFVENEVQSIIRGSQVARARHLAEQTTNGGEYRELLDQFTFMNRWPQAVRDQIKTRLLEIQRNNGYKGADINPWSVVPAWLNAEHTFNKDVTWDESSLVGLRMQLQNAPSLEVLQTEIHARSVAAQALKALGSPRPE